MSWYSYIQSMQMASWAVSPALGTVKSTDIGMVGVGEFRERRARFGGDACCMTKEENKMGT
jgi:hypothetical protein